MAFLFIVSGALYAALLFSFIYRRSPVGPAHWKNALLAASSVLCGGAAALLYASFSRPLDAALASAFLIPLLLCALCDALSMRIPDPLLLAALIPGIVYRAVYAGIPDALFGLLLGGGLLLAVRLVSRARTGAYGLGMGDVKLMAAAGVYMGLRGTAVSLAAGFLLCGVASVVLMLAGRKKLSDPMPLGAFLVSGIFFAVLAGDFIYAALT